MDSEILFWLFLAAVYILQALASKRKKTGPLPSGQTPDAEADMPSDLDDALGEIGRVLRGEAPRETPAQQPAPSAKPSSLPEPHYQVEPERPARRKFEPVPVSSRKSPSEPLELGGKLAASPIFYDQAFENQTADTFRAPIITHDHVFGFRKPKIKEDTTHEVERPDLRDHMVSRQSFIAAELLAPPLSKRGRKR